MFVNILRALASHTLVRQGCTANRKVYSKRPEVFVKTVSSLFWFRLVMDEVMGEVLGGIQDLGVDLANVS